MAERVELVRRAFTAYTVERELGSGGMATVYLAHDKKHDRKVAIKILHAELAAVLGAERFLQEIRVTANLQHPHILGLIDSGLITEDAGEFTGRPYYVMPYVEGESLRQRLEKEQQLPVSDAVRIATEVASALDYAHRHGVIHRDIKPENILLHDGSAIVADFGIALAVTEAGGPRMTQTGLALGTDNYMSPEQGMGERTITARSDIYALGVVTYEMLAGEPPFTGPTLHSILAKIMNEDPRPLTTVRRNVPQHVALAVTHALERIPADRFGSAHEFAEALNNPAFTFSATSASRGRNATRGREKWMLYGAGGFALLLLATMLWGLMRPANSKQVLRYNLALDSGEAIVPGGSYAGRLALSADGSLLAYVGGPRTQLLIRPRDQLHAIAVPGTEGANTPFFSPDGNYVGFLGEAKVQFAPINGGPLVTVSDTMTGVAGAAWGPDGFIYVDGEGPSGLVRVEAKSGQVPKWFTVLDTARGEFDHLWPDALPNGKGLVFSVVFREKNGVEGRRKSSLAVAEIPSGKHRVIVDDAMYGRYSPSGHLLYVTSNRTLMFVPFDQNSMKITGDPIVLLEGMRLGDIGSADLTVSEAGTLVYGTGAGEGKYEFAWVTRDGQAQSVDPDWQGNFWNPSLSPDGRQLAMAIPDCCGNTDIWVKQLDRGPIIKVSLDPSEGHYPTWAQDGRSVIFSSNAASGPFNLWNKRADGSGQAVLQFHAKINMHDARWSPDGKWLIFLTSNGVSGSSDILGIRPGIDTVALPLVATKFTEAAPTLSPDGRLLAYTSNETGEYEIYVVPFPNTSTAKWAVSTRGGTEPLWSHSGRELFYRDGSANLVAVELNPAPTFSPGRSTTLFPIGGFRSRTLYPEYAVSPDDRRFLMIRRFLPNAPDKLIVVENWFEELKARPRK
jgi:eukaryotic-like serine/threonine-protein kinase